MGIFAHLKFGLDYYTPDEVFYTSPLIDPSKIKLKFLITKPIFTYIHNINPYLLPVFNMVVVIFVLRFFYIKFIKIDKNLPYYYLFIIFLLPSVIYFSAAYLRDFYIYVFALLFFYSSEFKLRVKFILILIIGILRYETGIILIMSILIDKIIFRKSLISFNSVAFVFSIFFTWLILLLLIQNDFLFNEFFRLLNRYEIKTTDFSIFQQPVTKVSILTYSIPNWVAYWMPFFFKPLKATFDYFLLLDAIVILVLITRLIFKYCTETFKTDKMYRIAILVLFATFFVSLPESVPETMIRHHMAYLPALLYLNFPSKKK